MQSKLFGIILDVMEIYREVLIQTGMIATSILMEEGGWLSSCWLKIMLLRRIQRMMSFKTSLHRGIFSGKNEDIVNNNLGHMQLHLEKVLFKKGS